MAKYQRGVVLQNQKFDYADVIIIAEPDQHRLAYGPQGWEPFYEVRRCDVDGEQFYMVPCSALEDESIYKLVTSDLPHVDCTDCGGRGGRWDGDPCHGYDKWHECNACKGNGNNE